MQRVLWLHLTLIKDLIDSLEMSGDLLTNTCEKCTDNCLKNQFQHLLDDVRKLEIKVENMRTILLQENKILKEKLNEMRADKREWQNKYHILEIGNQTLRAKLNRCKEVFDMIRSELNESLSHKRMMRYKYCRLIEHTEN